MQSSIECTVTGIPESRTIDDGVKGLAFIEAAVKSSKANGKWVKP